MVTLESTGVRSKVPETSDARQMGAISKTVAQIQTALNRAAESVTRVMEKLTGYDHRLDLLERPHSNMPDLSEPIAELTRQIGSAAGEFKATVTGVADRIEKSIATQTASTTALFQSANDQIGALRTSIQQGDMANVSLIGMVRDDLSKHIDTSTSDIKRCQQIATSFQTRLDSFVVSQERLVHQDGQRQLALRSAEDRIQRLEARPIVSLGPALDAANQVKQQVELHWEETEELKRKLTEHFQMIVELQNELESVTWWTLFKQMWRRK